MDAKKPQPAADRTLASPLSKPGFPSLGSYLGRSYARPATQIPTLTGQQQLTVERTESFFVHSSGLVLQIQGQMHQSASVR